ncbi:Immunoglobulin-binding protein 1 [Gryllus bimaculatus]|nr:Immunoglobulin-binding protein 1 [Gryllus bimaculatus]
MADETSSQCETVTSSNSSSRDPSNSDINVTNKFEGCCLHAPELYPSLKSTEVHDENRKLSDIYKEGLNLFDFIANSDAPTNSVETQAKVKKAMNLFEEATRLVSAAGIFSRNESVEEIATNNVKYLLLPAFLGTLILKLCVDERMEVVRTAEVYFRDFLQRCKDYGISEFEMPEPDDTSEDQPDPFEQPHRPCSFDLASMARERSMKIQRFKELKELEGKLKDLKALMALPDVPEEVERKYYLTTINMYINQSFDELACLKVEKPLLAHMAKVKKDPPFGKQERRDKVRRYEKKPLMPIIITRDEVQKKVYGAGYPSIPTMTVAEFYDKKVKDGEFPDPTKPSNRNALQDRAPQGTLGELTDPSEEERADKERKEEVDDPENLERAREWDDWKDDHRRGWGNRMNRS